MPASASDGRFRCRQPPRPPTSDRCQPDAASPSETAGPEHAQSPAPYRGHAGCSLRSLGCHGSRVAREWASQVLATSGFHWFAATMRAEPPRPTHHDNNPRQPAPSPGSRSGHTCRGWEPAFWYFATAAAVTIDRARYELDSSRDEVVTVAISAKAGEGSETIG